MEKLQVYKSLQSCRAIAAMLVFLYHLGATVSLEKYFGTLIFYKPFSFGDCGVEFFFVLSGFIIHNAHHKDFFNRQVLVSYIKKRIFRIFPVYWIILSALYISCLFVPQLGAIDRMTMQEVIKSFLLIPSTSSGVSVTGAPLIVVAWSLHYEILFYAIVGFFIAGRIGTVSIIMIILACWIFRYQGFELDYPFLHISRDYLLLFLMGTMVSYFNQLHVHKVWVSCAVSFIGLFLFISVALDQVYFLGWYNNFQTLMFGLSFSLVICGLSNSERAGFVIGGNPVLQVLGNASYSLYLLHFPLISIFCKICVYLGINNKGLFLSSIAYTIILLLCIFISVKFHTIVEKPLTHWLRKRYL